MKNTDIEIHVKLSDFFKENGEKKSLDFFKNTWQKNKCKTDSDMLFLYNTIYKKLCEIKKYQYYPQWLFQNFVRFFAEPDTSYSIQFCERNPWATFDKTSEKGKQKVMLKVLKSFWYFLNTADKQEYFEKEYFKKIFCGNKSLKKFLELPFHTDDLQKIGEMFNHISKEIFNMPLCDFLEKEYHPQKT